MRQSESQGPAKTATAEQVGDTHPKDQSTHLGGPSVGREAMGLPRAPILGWSSFRSTGPRSLPSVDDTVDRAYTTSGRSALYQALRQLCLPPGSEVLVPSYHCPTMVAPILRAGAIPKFFGIGRNGLPDLDSVDAAWTPQTRALISAHYFGLPHSLAEVREWCDSKRVALVEDCAHTLFGIAGDRPVGRWGDFATASLSKFLPVPEAGVLISNRGPLRPLELGRRQFLDQIKGLVDVIEVGVGHGRLAGLHLIARPILSLKKHKGAERSTCLLGQVDEGAEQMYIGCDMGRIDQRPLWVSQALIAGLPRSRIVARRQSNFARLASNTIGLTRARGLFQPNISTSAPYVFPLWVDEAERVYRALRELEAPVFRWDRVWPGTPSLTGDQGPDWSRHVLQVLCHQDLGNEDIDRVSDVIRNLVNS